MEGKDRIKILYTIPNFDTAGSGKAMLKIATRLPDDFEPMICCVHDRGDFFEEVRNSGIPIHLYPYVSPMTSRIKGVYGVWNVSRFFRQLKPDIIHSFHYASDYSEALSARLAGVRWVYTKKNMNWGGKSANGWRLRTWLADGIAAQNTDMMRDFFQSNKSVSLIPRGVDLDEFYPQLADANLRRHFNIGDHCFVVCCVANLVPVKGVDILLKAIQSVVKVDPSVHLLVVGDNRSEYGDWLAHQVTEKGLDHHVTFTGKRRDVSRLLALSDLFVLPTKDEGRREGSPVSLLEAMACGIPVLASNVPGIRDQLAPFSDRLFSSGDDVGLARLIFRSIKNRSSERLKAIECVHYVRENFSIEKEVLDHVYFYRRCLRKGL